MTDIAPFPGLYENITGRMQTAFLGIDAQGQVDYKGIDQPVGTLVKTNGSRNLIVVKVPGHSYWASLGEQGYAPAEYQIFWLIEKIGDSRFKCAYLGSVPVRSTQVNVATAINLLALEMEE